MIVHTRTRAVRRRLAVGAMLPVLALTACGGGSDQASDDPGSSESSESPAASSEPYDTDTIIPAMEAALGDQSSARVQMDLTGQLQMSMDGQMEMTQDPADGKMAMTMDIQGQTLELRLVDGLIYVSGPPATPEGKWLEVDPNDPNDPAAQQFAGITKSGDLNTTLDGFKQGLEKVEYVGEEEIDGEQTQHYIFTVDSAKAFKAQGQDPAPGAPETLTYDVWLNQDDLMRRVSFELGPVQAQIDATEWGEPVEVEKPAAGDIVEGPGGATS